MTATDRCAGCEETLDPLALDVIAALTSPGSRALWSRHVISPHYTFKRFEVTFVRVSYFKRQNYSTKLWCIYDVAPFTDRDLKFP